MAVQDIPASVGWLTVTAEGMSARADSDDPGDNPDSRPMFGTVELTTNLAAPLVAIGETPKLFISVSKVTCEFDEDGVLRPPADGVKPPIDETGAVRVVAPDQPDALNDTDWKWTASFKPSAGQTWKAFTVPFTGKPGDTINLADEYLNVGV